MNKIYKCKCGKEFDDPQKFNGHKSRCKIHLGQKKYALFLMKAKEQGILYKKRAQEKNKQKIEELNKIWISEKHICEKCGKIMTEKYGSGRFCSKSCANSRIITEKQKSKIKATILETLKNKNEPEKILKLNRTFCGYYNNIYCNSGYELVFLIYCLENNIKIERCKLTFEYVYKNKKHTYFPDFYLPESNTIIELKGWSKKYNEDIILAKNKAVIEAGYPFKIIYTKELFNVYWKWLCKKFNLNFSAEQYKDFCFSKFENKPLKESKKHAPRTKNYVFICNPKTEHFTSVPYCELETYLRQGYIKYKRKKK